MKGSMADQAQAANEVVSAQAQGTLPAPIKDPKIVGPIMKSVWQQYTATAEKFNEPGRFTAMIGYEWTSVPGGNNLHRNVLFRDGKDKADQVFPFSRLEQREPREALGVDGEVRGEDRRQAARHPPQRQPLQRPDVRARGLRAATRSRRTTPSGGPLGGAAGDRPDEGQ